jgi:rod shape-determining protein MreC
MAPPSSRRPGFSRRAQYGLFIGYVVAVGGVLLAALLLLIAVLDPRGFRALRGMALDITTPVTAGARGVVTFITGGGESIGNYFFAASKNAELKRRLAATRQKLVEARAIEYENRRLKNLLKLAETTSDDVTTARIVGSTFDTSRRLATLAAGSASGIAVGMPVRAPEGLIGRVIETGRYASRVLLITDGANNVPVRLVRDGTPALATGRGDGTIDIKPLEVGNNQFRRGDLFVTSGTGGIYPPNIPVAQVVEANRDDTVGRPVADPARIDFAIVQQIFQPAATQPLVQDPAPTVAAAEPE